MEKKFISIASLCCIAFMVIYTLPFFAFLFADYYTWISAAFFAVWFIIILGVNGGKLPYKNRYCLVLLIYMFVFIVCAIFGLGDAREAVLGFTVYWIFGFVLEYYAKKQEEALKVIVTILLCFVALTAITTIISYFVAGIQSKFSDLATDEMKNQLNIGQYAYINAISILCPMTLAMFINFEGVRKYLTGALFVLLIACCFVSGYTIALLVALLGCFVYLLMLRKRKAVIINGILLLMLIIVLFNLEAFIHYIKEINPHLSERLMEILSYTDNKNSDLGLRMNLLEMSFETFKENPLTGVGPYIHRGAIFGIGEHSQILDDLARFGIASIVLFITFMKIYITRYTMFKQKWYSHALYATVIAFVLLSFVNPTFLLPDMGLILLFIIPAIGVFAKEGDEVRVD